MENIKIGLIIVALISAILIAAILILYFQGSSEDGD